MVIGREVPKDQKSTTVTPVFESDKKEDLGTYKPCNLTSVPGKVMVQLLLGSIYKHMKDKNVLGLVSIDL